MDIDINMYGMNKEGGSQKGGPETAPVDGGEGGPTTTIHVSVRLSISNILAAGLVDPTWSTE